jgi:hypothetical protein
VAFLLLILMGVLVIGAALGLLAVALLNRSR